jgi:hypothetical protein
MKAAYIVLILLSVFSTALFAQAATEQFKSADQSLILMPTAYTMPQGKSTFTDYEVVFVQYAYGLTDRTHLSVGMLFPIVPEAFEYAVLGVKQNYLKYKGLQSAAIVSFSPKTTTGLFGNAISLGNSKASLHGDIFWGTDFEDVSNGFLFGVGGLVNVSNRVALMSEVISFSELLDEDANGVWTMGVRLKGDGMSWDLGGFRMLKGDQGSLILIPLIKMTVLF